MHELETAGCDEGSVEPQEFYQAEEFKETDQIMVKFDQEFQQFYNRKNSLMINIKKLEEMKNQIKGDQHGEPNKLMTQVSTSLLKSTDNLI